MKIKISKDMTIDDIILSIIPILMKESKFRLNRDKLKQKLQKLHKYNPIIRETDYIEAHVYRTFISGTDSLIISIRFMKGASQKTIYRSSIYYNTRNKLPIKYIKKLIESIENDDNIKECEWLTDYKYDKKQQNKIDNLRYLITDILCCNYTTPDYNNIIILENNDIKVTEGERDSFGWLTAVLHLKKGKILLG